MTTTPLLVLNKQALGDPNWHTLLNNNFDKLDAAYGSFGHINVKNPGGGLTAAVGDGTTDDTSAIQAILNAVGSLGGRVFFPVGAYKITSVLTVASPSTMLLGAASYGIVDVTVSPMPGAVLKWGGSAGGTVLKFAPATGAGNPALKRPGLRDLSIDGNNVAAIGLQLLSCQYGCFENIWITECTTACLDTNVVTPLGEVTTTSRNVFSNIIARNINATSGIGIRLDGTGDPNTTSNMFHNVYLVAKDASALQLGNADANTFINFHADRVAAGIGKGIELKAGSTSVRVARNNQFFNCSAGAGGVLARGTPSDTSPSRDNWLYGYNTDQASGEPAIETGSTLSYLDSFGKLQMTVAAVLKISGSARRATTEGTSHLDIFDGTAPVGALAGGISLYSTSGELRVMDAAGNATLLSPHDRQGRWIFDSVDGKTGRHLRIDVEQLLRIVNERFGLDCIREI